MRNNTRLSQAKIKPWREVRLKAQGGKCALCRQPVKTDEAVADHCHKTGHLRGVLHRGCNAQLGTIENNMPRNKLTSMARLSAFLRAIPEYISTDYSDQPLHYTFRTEDEKRELRNKRARADRAKKKKEGKA